MIKHKLTGSAQYKQHNTLILIIMPSTGLQLMSYVYKMETHELKHVHKQAEFYAMLQVQYAMAVTIF